MEDHTNTKLYDIVCIRLYITLPSTQSRTHTILTVFTHLGLHQSNWIGCAHPIQVTTAQHNKVYFYIGVRSIFHCLSCQGWLDACSNAKSKKLRELHLHGRLAIQLQHAVYPYAKERNDWWPVHITHHRLTRHCTVGRRGVGNYLVTFCTPACFFCHQVELTLRNRLLSSVSAFRKYKIVDEVRNTKRC